MHFAVGAVYARAEGEGQLESRDDGSVPPNIWGKTPIKGFSVEFHTYFKGFLEKSAELLRVEVSFHFKGTI